MIIGRFLSASPRYAEDDGLNPPMGDGTTGEPLAQGQGSAEAPVADDNAPLSEFDVGVGQAATEEPTATGAKPFYQYDWGEEGGLQEWKSKEEFDEFFRGGVLRHRDYTNKTKELGSQREEIESMRKRNELLETQLLEGSKSQRELRELLDTLSEEEFQEVIQDVRKRHSYARNPALKRLDELEKRDKEREEQRKAEEETRQADARRRQVYQQLGKELGPEFNQEQILKEANKLRETPPGEEVRQLALLLHYAGIGRMRAAEYARRLQGNATSTPTPTITPAVSQGVAAGNEDYSDMDWNEISEAAKQETGLK